MPTLTVNTVRLRKQRAALADEAEQILDAAEADERALTPAESAPR